MSADAIVLPTIDAWLNKAFEVLSQVARREAGSSDERSEEKRLVDQAAGGGPRGREAFGQLVRLHHPWLINFLTCLLARPSDAEDVAQEVLVRAFLAIDRFEQRSSLRTWLRRIALNQAYNHRRAEAPVAAVLDASVPASLPPINDVLERQLVLQIMAELPHIYREVLVLRYVESMELREITRFLDIGLSAAKMRLVRGRAEFVEAYRRRTES